MASRCLWNSFVMVGQVGTFRDLIRRALPELLDAFESLPGDLGEFYRRTAPRNFSMDVLAAGVSNLAVLAADDLGWTDLGEPERVRAALRGVSGWKAPDQLAGTSESSTK